MFWYRKLVIVNKSTPNKNTTRYVVRPSFVRFLNLWMGQCIILIIWITLFYYIISRHIRFSHSTNYEQIAQKNRLFSKRQKRSLSKFIWKRKYIAILLIWFSVLYFDFCITIFMFIFWVYLLTHDINFQQLIFKRAL